MENTEGKLTDEPIYPALDCPKEELVAYIRSMKGGERVMEMGGSCMQGEKGTVEIREGRVLIRWDWQDFTDRPGVMVTSFTGGARIIQENPVPDKIYVSPEEQKKEALFQGMCNLHPNDPFWHNDVMFTKPVLIHNSRNGKYSKEFWSWVDRQPRAIKKVVNSFKLNPKT